MLRERSCSCSCTSEACGRLHSCSCTFSSDSCGERRPNRIRQRALDVSAYMSSQPLSMSSRHNTDCSCSCSCDCSCSSSCSCSTGCDSSRSCSCSCSCSCCRSAYSSACRTCGRGNDDQSDAERAPHYPSCQYSKDFLSVAPLLIRFGAFPPPRPPEAPPVRMFPTPSGLLPPPEPLRASTTTTETTQSLVSTRSADGSDIITTVSSGELRAAAEVTSMHRSIGMQTGIESRERGASPIRKAKTDVGTNTEMTLELLDQQQATLQQQTVILHQHMERCVILERQRYEVDREHAAFCEDVRRWQELQRETAVAQFIVAVEKSYSDVKVQEEEGRALLKTFMDFSRQSVISLQQNCIDQVQHQMTFAHQQRTILEGKHYDVIVDELWHRLAVVEMEEESRRNLHVLHDTISDMRRARERMTAAEAEVEHEKEITAAVRRDLQDVLQREKELQLKYLYILRMPTTTIISRDYKNNDGPVGGHDEWDDDMPVHVRFSRAHRAAVEAVSAKRRCSLELKCFL